MFDLKKVSFRQSKDVITLGVYKARSLHATEEIPLLSFNVRLCQSTLITEVGIGRGLNEYNDLLSQSTLSVDPEVNKSYAFKYLVSQSTEVIVFESPKRLLFQLIL